MKKNITINLCGRLFQIDEDAYEMLQQYIDSLRASFGKQEGGEVLRSWRMITGTITLTLTITKTKTKTKTGGIGTTRSARLLRA